MKIRTLTSTAIMAVLLVPASVGFAAEKYDAKRLHLKNVTGTIDVRSTNGSKIEIDINNGAGVIVSPTVSVKNGVVLVEGEKIRYSNCKSRDAKGKRVDYGRDVTKQNKNIYLAVSKDEGYRASKKDSHPLADYPKLIISVPKDAALEISGGRVFGEVGDLGEGDIQVNSCGAFALGNVAGDLDVQVNGSGDFYGRNVGGKLNAQINGSGDMLMGKASGFTVTQINGSGDLAVGKVSDGLHAQINGSGDITVKSVNGSVETQINGSGDILISEGKASSLHAQIIGSGDVTFNGHANNVRGQIVGSGDVTVASYDGEYLIKQPRWKRNKD